MDFVQLRRKLIEKDFGAMNDRQFEAVTTVDGPLLVLAGAGSGKTTVLVNRISNLVRYGNAYHSNYVPYYTEDDIAAAERYLADEDNTLPERVFAVDAPRPWEILAITFTNKAAGELRERINRKLGAGGEDLWAGTFHSICGKILRRNAEYIGFSSHFTIYDTDDQRRLMKTIMREHNVDEKFLPHKSVLGAISAAKDSLISPAELKQSAGSDVRQRMIAELYEMYQHRLREADAMDFDDMITQTVRLFRENEDVLTYYSGKFRYIMVDEYQDTNHAQYVLISLLAKVHGNLCVVGDDDQSIYRFRGATIENILNFEEEFSGAKVIRLEQNYRSTGRILDAANAVIKHNMGRKGKTLWTAAGEGEPICLYTAPDEREEARFVADAILDSVRAGASYSQHAVLYRMNAQAASLENVFARSGISYKVIGGFRFFERKEIRDVLAYLSFIN
ncbi:MAG: UvrD-helicase domain-containing protein, partial [Clostridia bacterium]|nr:UvrD-helicase domain-containing protein [Clostridia bacterium]